jgi:hypothetical protein
MKLPRRNFLHLTASAAASPGRPAHRFRAGLSVAAGGTSGGHTCSESIPGGDLVYKTTEDASLPASEPEPFYEPQAFNELQADTLAHLINELRDEWRKDHAVRSPSCAGKSRRCSRCSVNHTVSNLKNADVIDLPDWRWRRDVA